MMKLRPGETVVFAYVVFKSRAHRDKVNARVMKEMEKMDGPPDNPFDVKRMSFVFPKIRFRNAMKSPDIYPPEA